jgi:hypothetical protein
MKCGCDTGAGDLSARALMALDNRHQVWMIASRDFADAGRVHRQPKAIGANDGLPGFSCRSSPAFSEWRFA